jgi:hypothetical protein
MEGLKRDITVYGYRQMERGPTGELRFSEPEPFEAMPLRYDHAYGGVDLRAFLASWAASRDDPSRPQPVMPFAVASPFHYPRNPAGVGFVLAVEPYDLADLLVPNLEYDFDRVTPERLAVGAPRHWPAAPLPAGMDWSSAAWFPRQSYLGVHDLAPGFTGRLIERELGWVPEDLLEIPLASRAPGRAIRPGYAQGASPGMAIALPLDSIRRGITVKLVNFSPTQPDLRMELPREWPAARLGLRLPAMTELEPRLSAVVIRPAEQEVVMLWCAQTARERQYTPLQYAEMATDVEWRRDPR